MISRRNIRIKVLQTLYSIQTLEELNPKISPEKILKKELEQTRELFVYLIYFLTEVLRYPEHDARIRSHKNLPSHSDLNVNLKMTGNLLLWKIVENTSFEHAVAELKPQLKANTQDQIKRVFLKLSESPEYQLYINEGSRDSKKEKELVKLIFSDYMLPDEIFISHIEEHFSNWDDDADMMVQLMSQYIQKQTSLKFQEMVAEDKWLFAKQLLATVQEKKELVLAMISPKLKNWDADRIAVLDMLIMRMGVCEFLFFETIPVKVTINEYIDIAKEYSTVQSGQFVNGILDNINKELETQGNLNKTSFKTKKVK